MIAQSQLLEKTERNWLDPPEQNMPRAEVGDQNRVFRREKPLADQAPREFMNQPRRVDGLPIAEWRRRGGEVKAAGGGM